MKGELKHIFDDSACLSARQLKDYVAGHMDNDECHAVEHHLNSCPLCSAAVDGMLLQPQKALETMAAMNTDFLKEQFLLKNLQAQVNVAAPEAQAIEQPVDARPKPKMNVNINFDMRRIKRPLSIAAALLIIFVAIWYLRPSDEKNHLVAQKLETDAPAPQKEFKDEPIGPAENPVAQTVPAETLAADQDQAVATAAGAASTDDIKTMEQKKPLGPEMSAGAGVATKTPIENKLAAEKNKKDVLLAKESATTAAKPAAATPKAPVKEERRQVVDAIAATDEQSRSRAKTETVQAYEQSAPVTARNNEESKSDREVASGTAAGPPADSKLDKGKYYFEKQQYGEALKEYKGEINNSSKAKRHQASYMAAQCYLKLGNTKEAERLLKIIIDEGGSQKRHAKKLLESLEKKP